MQIKKGVSDTNKKKWGRLNERRVMAWCGQRQRERERM